ncbi:MAG: KH domain-containing protein [Campylobacterales bacterium]|nr:KH domain-containing protein [Campylobacterales bacterium]
MITQFVQDYARLIVANPDDVTVEIEHENDTFALITVTAHQDDIRKLIGKNGNMIAAIKTVINGCKAKDGISYKIQINAR